MAQTRVSRKPGGQKEHTAHWQQPWVKRVMQGGYSAFARLLFDRVSSFGAGGCWMENETLAVEFGITERYVQMLLTELWEGGELWITGWNSKNRWILAKNNPKVVEMAGAWYRKKRAAGEVTDLSDFYCKTKSRGHTTPKKRSGMGEETFGDGRTDVRGKPEQICGVHISKSRERNKEPELRQADSSLPVSGQSNPPAKMEMQAAIRQGLEKRMPGRAGGDWAEARRRLDLSVKLQGQVEELVAGGLSFEEAFDRVYNDNLELINGGKPK